MAATKQAATTSTGEIRWSKGMRNTHEAVACSECDAAIAKGAGWVREVYYHDGPHFECAKCRKARLEAEAALAAQRECEGGTLANLMPAITKLGTVAKANWSLDDRYQSPYVEVLLRDGRRVRLLAEEIKQPAN